MHIYDAELIISIPIQQLILPFIVLDRAKAVGRGGRFKQWN